MGMRCATAVVGAVWLGMAGSVHASGVATAQYLLQQSIRNRENVEDEQRRVEQQIKPQPNVIPLADCLHAGGCRTAQSGDVVTWDGKTLGSVVNRPTAPATDMDGAVDRASETLPGSSRDLVRAKMVCNEHMKDRYRLDFSYEPPWKSECDEVDRRVGLAYVAYKAGQDGADMAVIKKALGQ